jgi:hypothetical protein
MVFLGLMNFSDMRIKTMAEAAIEVSNEYRRLSVKTAVNQKAPPAPSETILMVPPFLKPK